ncbi:MAG: DUF262 and DUF1524 domain-containing protein [Acholeplasmatales bacterium]|nr:DUF262 and DUF1524 domain-containing protein [Acholeplasmatales bacterium]
MDAGKGNIFGLLNGLKQYIIPVYQRLYSWGPEQCKTLWNDIVNMQKKQNGSHFLGSIVCILEQTDPAGLQKYMVIDGQQRLTTLTLILIALRDSLKDDSDINRDELSFSFLINQFKSGSEKYKILLTEEDREILIALIDKKPIDKNVNSKLLNAYNYFMSEIESGKISHQQIREATGKLQIVTITLDRQFDDPQAIFESLNSTGKELSESDLIRNYILMGIENNEQVTLYQTVWRPMEVLFGHDYKEHIMDDFFRDYLTMKLARIPKQGDVYDEFKRWHINSDFESNQAVSKDLYNYADLFTQIKFAKFIRLSAPENEEINNLYRQIDNLNVGVSMPFLLFLSNDFKNGVIQTSEYCEILRLIISYAIRRGVCEIPTNSLNKTFATLKNEIVRTDYLNSIKAYFIKRDDYKRFPNDAEFGEAFVTKEIYKARNRNYILDMLENYDNKSPVTISKLTIEHVMPQNKTLSDEWKNELGPEWERIHKTYLHTIGNLTLTGYNSEMSDKPFMEKMTMKGGFKQTAVRLNTYIIEQTGWNENNIQERAELLKSKALEIWPFPSLSSDEMAPYLDDKDITPMYSLDSYNLNLVVKNLFYELDRNIMNLSGEIKREYTKLYVAYKLDTNFVDVMFKGNRLQIVVNMKYDDIDDPKGLCKDVSGIGHHGNGDCMIYMDHTPEVEDIMYIIKQSYEKMI